MADTFSTNLHLTLPEIGASDDTWGNKLNDDLAALDALFGTTGTGTVIVRDSNNDALVSGINVTKAAGNDRIIRFKSGASQRWTVLASSAAESGSNAGSRFQINRYDDSANFLGIALGIDRDTGLVTFETTPKVGSNAIYHAGNDTVLRAPVGGGMWFFGAGSAPTNWLFAYGQVLSTTTYAALYAILGTYYNTGGEGAGNFRMPDLRDVCLVGKGDMGGSARGVINLVNTAQLGQLLGAQSVALTASQIPAHKHSMNFNSLGADYSVGPTVALSNGSVQASGAGGTFVPTVAAGSTNISPGAHTHAVYGDTDNGTGGGQAHSNLQPFTLANFIIRAF